MREELKRSNSIGNFAGIELFQNGLFDGLLRSKDAVINLCNHDMSAQFSPFVAMIFFEELGIICTNKTSLVLSEFGKSLRSKSSKERTCRITKRCIEYLINYKLMDFSKIRYESQSRKIEIQLSAFSLSSAVFRNYLVSVNALAATCDGYVVQCETEEVFEELLSTFRHKITQEKLLSQLEKQQKDGEMAELFVLEYEMKRLGNGYKPKRISTIDVGAGYDIISYDSSYSQNFDRYIEVKSFWGKPHFYWSENELKTAKLYNKQYLLYLVDMCEMLRDSNTYVPIIICNPANTIMTDGWLIESVSYRVSRII